MTPKLNGNIGKILAGIGVICGLLGTFITTLKPMIIGQDYADTLIAFGVFLTAFSVYLAHKGGTTP